MLVLMVVGVTALRVAMGRMRIDKAFFFYLKWPLLLSIASVVTVVVVARG
jgi:NADH-quinone oxidoreductase subunit H